jgi:hypothetical protein
MEVEQRTPTKCIYMADAGSSGTKLFVKRLGEKLTEDIKVFSACGNCVHRGVAAMACDTTDATCKITRDNKKDGSSDYLGDLTLAENLTPTNLKSQLPEQLIATLRKMRTKLGCTDLAFVPIMATAGMRLLTPDQQQNVWTNICGKIGDANQIKFMDQMEDILPGVNNINMCGTIAGTTEAFFEYVADWTKASNDVKNDRNHSKITLTMGGASAQMAVKMTDAQYTDFQNNVNSSLAPFTAMKNSAKFFKVIDSRDFGKLILVSFLGRGEMLNNDNKLISIAMAGGANSIQDFVDEQANKGAVVPSNYSATIATFEKWLNADDANAAVKTSFNGDRWWNVIQHNVMPMFAQSASSVVFNTFALHDDKIMLDPEWKSLCDVNNVSKLTDEQKYQVVEQKLLGRECTKNGSLKFGRDGENTCYKVWWIHQFKQRLGRSSLAPGKNMITDTADWSNGVLFLLENRDATDPTVLKK